MDLARTLVWLEPWMVADFVAPPFDEGQAKATLAAAGRSADEHATFLRRWNGGYALKGNLHFFGARAEPPNQSLDRWNRPEDWRQSFGPLLEGCWFFADTAFGDQFGYREGKVVWLRATAGRMERMAASFGEWLEQVIIDPGRYLSTELFEACVRQHGMLPPGGHFALRGPTPAGDVNAADPFVIMPARDNMEMRGVASMTGVSRPSSMGVRRPSSTGIRR